MATIVNARDTLIQAQTPRVASVSLADNVQVSQANVTGLGLVVDGTKEVWVGATSQVFQIPKTGSIAPASISIVANTRNLASGVTPTLTVVSGTVSGGTTLVDGVFTLTPANMTTDVVTFRLSATDTYNGSPKTYTDDITIVKVREGADALVGYLTNESVTLPADYLGNVTAYTGASGDFKVYQGTNDITSACTFSVVAGSNADGLTNGGTSAIINTTSGAYAVTGNYPTNKELTSVTLRATFGSNTLDKVFTVAKAKAGNPGTGAKTLTLTVTAQTFTFAADNTTASPSSQTITFTAVGQNLTGSPSMTATLYNSAGTSLGAVTLGGTSTSPSRTLTVAQFAAAAYCAVSCTWDSITDNTTVVRLKDGVSGANAVVGFLTNEAMVVAADSAGTVSSFTNAGGTFKVFDGLVDKTGTAGPVTYSVAASSGVTISIASTGVYTVTAMSADTGTATLRAVYNGVTIDKTYSIAKSKAGVNGTNGTNGVNGQRGSRTYYVALSGSTAVWSDTLANTTAAEGSGPILRDVVTQYNNSQNFSQTKFWDGAVWQIVNAVVDGNLLVSGTVGAGAIATDSVLTKHLKVTSHGRNLNLGADCSDATAWVNGTSASSTGTLTSVSISDGVAGQYCIRTTGPKQFYSHRFLVSANKRYRLSFWCRRTSVTGTGVTYGRVNMYNAAGTWISGTDGYLVTTDVGGTLEGFNPPTTWTFYQGYIDAPSGATSADVSIHSNWSTSTGVTDFQDLRCEEYVGGDIVLDGTLAARHIDTKGLSIKDMAGNVILAAGMPLATDYVASAQNLIPNSDVTQSITWGYSALGTSTWGYTGLRWASQEAGWTTANYVLAGLTTRNIYVRQDGVDATGGNSLTTMNIFPLGGYSTSYQVPAIAGQSYCFSAYIQAHRCEFSVALTFFNSSGVLIGPAWSSTQYSPPGGTANTLGVMTRAHVIAVAPAGTAFVRCYISKCNTTAGQTNSYLWVAAPMLEPVGANVTGPSTYQPGGVSAVTQLGYTGALNATNNIVTSSSTAPSSPTDGDIWVDTSVTPNLTKVRVSGAWVTGASNGAVVGTNLYNGASAITANQVLNGYLDGSVTRIASPQGGSYGTNTATITGAIKITLPQSWTNTMLRFRVDVYDYAAGASVSYDVGGYNYSGGWTNCFATATGNPAKVKTVRFAHDGTKCCVLIGETTSTHAYPQIRVYDFVAGYSNHAVANWDDSWAISFITTLPANVDVVETSPVPGGAMSGIDAITAANISTYIAAGCIGDAYIGNFIKSTAFDGTIDGSGNITANGTTGWAISKGGNAVFNSGTFRGTLNVKSAASGARTEITNSVMKVYDSSGTLRVKLGDLSA